MEGNSSLVCTGCPFHTKSVSDICFGVETNTTSCTHSLVRVCEDIEARRIIVVNQSKSLTASVGECSKMESMHGSLGGGITCFRECRTG